MSYAEYVIAVFTVLNTYRTGRTNRRIKTEAEAVRKHVTQALYQDRKIRAGEYK